MGYNHDLNFFGTSLIHFALELMCSEPQKPKSTNNHLSSELETIFMDQNPKLTLIWWIDCPKKKSIVHSCWIVPYTHSQN